MVVLPEPDTPVTTVSRPLGKRTSSGLTVWMGPVERATAPFSNRASGGTGFRRTSARPARKGPIWDRGFCWMSATVPSAITCPPPAPAPGPISTSQSAWRRIWVSWSTSSTELPSATRSCMTPVRPTMLAGCSPMEGSSST